jgi:hypothetical protein
MKKKFNPELLSEELKKFKMLCEYTFITGDNDKPLILGDENIEEADEAPSDLKPEDAAEKIAADLNIGGGEENTGGEPKADANTADSGGQANQDPNADLGGDFGGEENTGDEDMGGDFGGEESADNAVEVDVTSLVNGSEEAKAAADKAVKNSEMLLQKLTDLESRVASMASISSKIDGLEKEMVRRNPTPVEKLEMRSLDSYPFNQKLTDYWADKEGPYDVMKNKEKEEYVLTKDDVNHSFSDTSVKNSFNIQENRYIEESLSDYEEEDI